MLFRFMVNPVALRGAVAGALVCVLFLGLAPAWAKTVQLNGIRFTEASENVTILGVSGDGTLASPFILLEEIRGESEAVIQIEILSERFGSRIGSNHAVGFALTKIVTNRSVTTWDYFSMELEFVHGQGSDYHDGLSFAQAAQANRPFTSNRFKNVDDIAEPRDIVRFTQGRVKPKENAQFTVSITYTGVLPKFLLVQHIRRPYAGGFLDPHLVILQPMVTPPFIDGRPRDGRG